MNYEPAKNSPASEEADRGDVLEAEERARAAKREVSEKFKNVIIGGFSVHLIIIVIAFGASLIQYIWGNFKFSVSSVRGIVADMGVGVPEAAMIVTLAAALVVVVALSRPRVDQAGAGQEARRHRLVQAARWTCVAAVSVCFLAMSSGLIKTVTSGENEVFQVFIGISFAVVSACLGSAVPDTMVTQDEVIDFNERRREQFRKWELPRVEGLTFDITILGSGLIVIGLGGLYSLFESGDLADLDTNSRFLIAYCVAFSFWVVVARMADAFLVPWSDGSEKKDRVALGCLAFLAFSAYSAAFAWMSINSAYAIVLSIGIQIMSTGIVRLWMTKGGCNSKAKVKVNALMEDVELEIRQAKEKKDAIAREVKGGRYSPRK